MPDTKPLFEYRFHPPKKKNARQQMVTSGPPMVMRFCTPGTILIGEAGKLTTIEGPRLAELKALALAGCQAFGASRWSEG